MAKQNNRGLKIEKIPDHVLTELNGETIKLLVKDGHGISFPVKGMCQVRIRRNKEELSKSFAWSKFGGVQGAINTAIEWTCRLRDYFEKIGLPQYHHHGKNGVLFLKRECKRTDRPNHHDFEYSHNVWYRDLEGKVRHKSFWHGYNNPTPGQWLHGQNTALLFKHMVHEAHLKGDEVNREWFKGWKHKRLYVNSHPHVNYDEL